MENNKESILKVAFKRLESMLIKQQPQENIKTNEGKIEEKLKEKLPVIDNYKLKNSAREELVRRLSLPDSISQNREFKRTRQDIKSFSNIIEISEEMDLPCGTVKPVLVKGEIKTQNDQIEDFILFRLEDKALNLKNLTLIFKYRKKYNDVELVYDPEERFDLYKTSVKTKDGISRFVELLRITETDKRDKTHCKVSYYDKNGNWLLTTDVQEERTKEEKKFTHAFIVSESAYSYNLNFPIYLKNGIYDESLFKHFPCKPLIFKFFIGKFASDKKIVNPLTFINALSDKELRGIKTIFEDKINDYQYYNRRKILRKLTENQTLEDYVKEEHGLNLN